MTNFARGIFMSIAMTALLSANLVQAADVDNGRRVFETQCVVCHGPTGKADESSPVVQGLGVVPADFSDALFNSREPAGDWEMVIKYGGASLGLAEQMPAHEQVLSDDEIADVTAYAKTLADTSAYPPGEMNLMLPVRTKKAFPEDEVVYRGRFTPQDGDDAIKSVVEFEKRIGKRGQVILELVHEAEGSIKELSEAEVGYKQASPVRRRGGGNTGRSRRRRRAPDLPCLWSRTVSDVDPAVEPAAEVSV